MIDQQKLTNPSERGQSIVLIALMFIGLLAFVGLAVDVGFLYVRTAQFTAAVDAAALAGVVDLHAGGVVSATVRAEQFMTANNWPISAATSVSATESISDLGIPEFSFTITWPVETYFLRVIGFDDVPVTRSATAAYFAQTYMPVSTQVDRGLARINGQFVFGQSACTAEGDPVLPYLAASGSPNPTYNITQGRYLYAIRVSEDYVTNIGTTVRVQLFDPDTYNGQTGDSATYTLSTGGTSTGSCSSQGVGDSCIINTGESSAQNPYWIRRVDEVWTPNVCSTTRDVNQPAGTTITRYELYYTLDNGQQVSIAAYQDNNSNIALTDLQWTTPNPTGLGDVQTEYGSFDVDVSQIPVDGYGSRTIYVKVTTPAGTSKNGWDIWAGPTAVADLLPRDINARNLYILSHYATSSVDGVNIYAVGRMPVNFYADSQVNLPIAAVDAIQGGGSIYASVFDFDSGAIAPFIFTFDTLSPADFSMTASALCNDSTNCNNAWVNPQVSMGIPTREDGVAFFGGYLQAQYTPNRDEQTWAVSITSGRPFLTK